jgi:F-type H+-transporting ATPase subunit delta
MTSHEYALALFESVTPTERATCVDWFHLIEDIVDASSEYVDLMRSPNVTDEVKKQLLSEAFSDAPQSFLYFLYVVIDQDRFGEILEMAREFQSLLYEQDGVMVVDVITAVALSDGELTRLQQQLQTTYHKEILIQERVQPELIGGVRLVFQGKVIDQSIQTQTQLLQQSISRKVS